MAQSSAPAAVSVRHEISRLVANGRTDQQVEATLVATYGPSILLRPPASGLSAVVWIAPVVVAAGAAVGLGALFWRRGRDLGRLRRQHPR